METTAEWPENGLERASACPICGETKRELAHEKLRDRFFGCAPGEWNLYRCGACGAGYLDPRPTAATISLAYSRYSTHGAAGAARVRPSAWRRFRAAQRNAYLNLRHGYQLSPASALGLRWLGTARRQRFDKHVAYLPYPGKGARVLEIGCGNGDGLLKLREAGWDVCGVEPDPQAAAVAASAGLDVRAGVIGEAALPETPFDAVVLHHVIEHLHDPIGALRLCREALKPGGTISIATPNFDAAGHRIFGRAWFPLEPPRHLVLFTEGSLRRALATSGFEPESALQLRVGAQDMFRRSLRIQKGHVPLSQGKPLSWLAKRQADWLAWKADRATRTRWELTEELVLLARRRP